MTAPVYKYTLDRLCECIKREIDFRRRCYPGWVDAGKMKQHVAEEEIGMMQELLTLLTEAIETAERKARGL